MAIRGAYLELQAQERNEDAASISGRGLSRAAQFYHQRRLIPRAWVCLAKVRLKPECT